MYDELVKKIRHCATDPMHCLSCGEDKDGRCFVRLMTQAANAIEELSAIRDEQKAQIILMAAEIEEQQPRWIPVTERLPEAGVYVLAYSADDGYMCVEARHKFSVFQITHWMPLPEPPKEE